MDAEEKSIRERLSHPSVDRSVGYTEQQAPISVRQADYLLAKLDALRAKLAKMCREHEYIEGYCCHCGNHKPADPVEGMGDGPH